MNPTILVIIVFLVLTAICVPIFASVGLATIFGLHMIDIPGTLMAQTGFSALQPFPLLTIPLFVLSGQLMERGGTADRLINISQKLVGSYKGSLGLVTIIACMFFGALSGSGTATAAAIGSVLIPAMKKQGYSARFAAAVAASGGALGSMIPPSNLLIIYALMAKVSIPRLFLAGVIPGLLITLLLLFVAWLIASIKNFGDTSEKFTFKPLLSAFWEGKWALGTPVIIFGGIYGGIFTPTEAAAVAVFYALFVGLFVYRELKLKDILASFKFTGLMAGILILMTPTIAFGNLAAFFDIPYQVENFIASLTGNPYLIMLIIGVFYIFIGTFMESLAQVVLFTPVLMPVAQALGIDPVMFGIFTVLTCEIGFLTPPMGANLFITSRIAKTSVEDISIGVLPFILPYILVMLAMIFLPQITLALPDFFYGAAGS